MDAMDLIKYGLLQEDKKSVETSSCTLMDLFSSHVHAIPKTRILGQLRIPEYQRPYVWKEKELKKLISDISIFQKDTTIDKSLYYLGSLILHKKNNKLNIIDGQQRITTMLLWYSLQNSSFDFPLSFKSPVSIRQIQKNARFFKNELKLPVLRLEDFNVTLIVTHNEDDAYTFFETQNTGGVRLSGADIIKSHHLRAIEENSELKENAKSWEQLNHLTYVIDLITKGRYWNFLQWRNYPSFRNQKGIKEAIVDEFTERTGKEKKNTSYRQVQFLEKNGRQHIHSVHKGKSIRQPLNDGINVIQFFKEMVECYERVFVLENDELISSEFLKLRKALLLGDNGTRYIKELFELATIFYVNRFGYSQLYEFSLWAFRYVYSIRIKSDRTVRENSIFKFVRENSILDVIANAFTHEEVISNMQAYQYEFNDKNIEEKNVKGRFVIGLSSYFSEDFKNIPQVKKGFDILLKKEINAKLSKV